MGLVTMHDEAKTKKQEHDEAIKENKAQLFDNMRTQATERALKKQRDAELQAKREENMRRKEHERQLRAAENAHQLKNDEKAKSEAIVNAFVERTVPNLSTSVVLSAAAHGLQGDGLGATPGSIL